MITNFDKLCGELEKQELEAPTGVASPSTYAQLLAIYLYQNDLATINKKHAMYSAIRSTLLAALAFYALTSDIQEEAPWCMLFAYDIALVTESGLEVQSRLDMWWQRLKNVGLKLSRTKTEYLFCDVGSLFSPVPINLARTPILICSNFRYLGSLVHGNGEVERHIKHRIMPVYGNTK